MKIRYNLERGEVTVKHLLLMDNFKLYRKTEKELDRRVYSVRVFHNYIKMEFRIAKCGVLVMKKEKYT